MISRPTSAPSSRRLAVWPLLAALLLAFAPTARGTDADIVLRPPESGFRGPAESLRLYVPPSVPQALLETLALELDGFDVTALVAWDGDDIVYTPAEPLAFGTHTLRLLQVDGETLTERAQWQLDVRQSAALRQASAGARGEMALSRRLVEDDLRSAPARLQSSGAVEMQAAAADATWTASASVPLLHDSTGQALDGHRVDVGEFLFAGSLGQTRVRVGHHAPAPGSLVIGDGFSRRGISLHHASDVLSSSVDAFVTRASPVFGFRHGLGVSDQDNHVLGVHLGSVPFERNGHRLQLGASLIDGRRDDSGAAVLGESSAEGGSAWGVNLHLSLLDERLFAGGEFAASAFDFDEGRGTGAEADDARSLYLEARSAADATMGWRLGASYSRSGTFFRSLANPSLETDIERFTGYGQLSQGSWTLDASASKASDNVDGSPLLARVSAEQAYLGLTYAPPGPPPGLPAWLGQPAIGVNLSHEQLRTDTAPVTASSARAASHTTVAGLAASFSGPQLSWGIDYTLTEFDDHTGLNADTRSHSAGLQASLAMLDRRLTVRPSLRYDFIDERDLGSHQQSWLAALGVNYTFLPGRLDGDAALELASIDRSDGLASGHTWTGSAALYWTVAPVRAGQPGLIASLEGSWRDSLDRATPALSINDYQAFVRLRLVLPESH